jgi:hypothetical protein
MRIVTRKLGCPRWTHTGQVTGSNFAIGVSIHRVTIKTVGKCSSGYVKIITWQNALLRATTHRAQAQHSCFGAVPRLEGAHINFVSNQVCAHRVDQGDSTAFVKNENGIGDNICVSEWAPLAIAPTVKY